MSQKMQDHPFGKPISILSVSNSNKFVKESDELDKIFNHPEIQDRKVVILSLVGAFRGGKSFFLDYCLRFLYAHFPSINNPTKVTKFIFEKNEEWMGNPDEPLSGFSWSAGTDRNTHGIIMWSDVFLYTMDRTGEKIAIFIMDTQGLFDSQSTPTDNSRIFALSTLISSIQVLNLKNIIQEDQLQYLQFAVEFAQYSVKKKENVAKAFQNLIFLVRDWQNEEEFDFGLDGGKKYFEEKVLMSNPTQKPELRSVREFIKSSFDLIGCCLLPHPGKKVTNRKAYKGCWSVMDKDFRDEFQKFIEFILLPKNMVLKKVNSEELKGKEMKTFIDQYLDLFVSTELPETKTIFELTVESQLNNLIEKCVSDYKLAIYRNKDLVNVKTIPIVHEKCMERVLKMYDEETKMCNKQHEKKFKAKLCEKLQNIYVEFKEQREFNIMKIEKEAKKQQAELEKERQATKMAEEDKKQAENLLMEIREKNKNGGKAEESRELELILTERLRNEQERIDIFKSNIKSETLFRTLLCGAVAATVGLANIGVMAAGGVFAAGGAIVGGIAGAVEGAKKGMDNATSNCRKVLNESENTALIPLYVPAAGVAVLGGAVGGGVQGGLEGAAEKASEIWNDFSNFNEKLNQEAVQFMKDNNLCLIM